MAYSRQLVLVLDLADPAQQVSVEARQKSLKDREKSFKLTTTVLLILVLTYSPIMVVRILIVKSVLYSVNVTHIVFFTATFVVVLNSLFNPIIYCDRIRQFRVAFIESSSVAFRYYHFRSTLKRDDFFAYVYVLNVTVLSGYVSL